MMKLSREELVREREVSPLELFYQGIKADRTREKYSRTLRQVLCKMLEEILEGTFEERVIQLVQYGKQDPQWTRDMLLSLSRMLRQRTKLPHDHPEYLNPVSFGGYFKPIKKLFDMNDVTIPWKRIYATYPELDNVSESRGWSRGEIQNMLRHVDGPMDRAIILVSASSGIRVGGFDLSWKDLTPIYSSPKGLCMDGSGDTNVACAMLRIYAGTSESYSAFITPEAYDAIQEYRDVWIKQVGRPPRPEDPIFKQDGILLRRATLLSVTKRISKIIRRAGLRDGRPTNNRRYEVPMMNGFRRFWNKTCKESMSKESALASLIKKEYMMGHVGLVKLDRNYFKTHVLELAEEYLNVVPNLTISDNERLRQSNMLKDEKIRRLESEKDARILDLERVVAELADRMDTNK